MINEATYREIKRRIKTNIVLNNGYQFDDLCHDTIEKLILKKKTNEECKKLCVITALNLIRDHHRKCSKLKTVRLYDLEHEPILQEKTSVIIPEKYKKEFILKYKFGMKYKEISEYLEIPIGTVKGQIYKMHKELKSLNL
jgi:DNA-directed RNA polymerase specialized sigma24 family protein